MPETQDQKPEPKRIAVVAIHGVGDHEQFATAREIGDLLSNLTYSLPGDNNPPRYAPFTEVMTRINVRPVKTDADETYRWGVRESEKNTWGPMDELARAVFENKLKVNEADNSPASLDHLFMKGQLMKHRAPEPDDTYQCLRLEGHRVPPMRQPGEAAPHPAADAAGKLASHLRKAGVALAPQTGDEGSPGTEEKIVHIYEMYWADLSKLGNGFTQIFSELYQVLFHLGSVSVNNILAAAIHFHGRSGGDQWRAFSDWQRRTAAILAWPIPILTLFMAALLPVLMAISFMRTHLFAGGEFLTLDILAAAAFTAGCGYGLSRFRHVRWPVYLAPLPLLGVLAGTAGFLFDWRPWNRDVTETLCAGILLLMAVGLVWAVVKAYDRRRPGSKAAATWIGATIAASVLGVFSLGGIPVGGSAPYPAISICLNILEVSFFFLAVSWIAFYGCYVWAHIAGWRALRAVPQWIGKGKEKKPNPEYTKARRTRWTAQLVLALSSMAFIVLTVPVGTGLASVAEKMLPGGDNEKGDHLKHKATEAPCNIANCPKATYKPIDALFYRFAWNHGLDSAGKVFNWPADLEARAEKAINHPPLVSAWATDMWIASGIGFLPILLCALLVALLFTGWAIFPSVRDEIRPPDTGPSDESQEERRQAADSMRRQSVAMGNWLDHGFRLMRWAGEIVYWTMVLVAVVFLVSIQWMYMHQEFMQNLTRVIGTLVAGAAVGIFGFAGRIKSVGGAFRPLVRVMLDVDNWLREHPRDSNPTARICARYSSLLRHICSRKDKDGRSYDAIVIIAHSQGTVITADFLRYLNAEMLSAGSMAGFDPELALFDKPLPVYLFTMGCPLHQLYGLRFPYLYGWARNDVPEESPEPGKPPDIGSNEAPRPKHLGVKQWVNAYRSGDYVGRHLWRGGGTGYLWEPIDTSYKDEWDPPAGKPEKVSADKGGYRIECCIGPGAHTHYWDHTAELIAEVLDRIINNAGKPRLATTTTVSLTTHPPDVSPPTQFLAAESSDIEAR